MDESKEFKKPTYSDLPAKIDDAKSLFELALDLRWSWDHSADEVWRQLDPELWDLTQNPWLLFKPYP